MPTVPPSQPAPSPRGSECGKSAGAIFCCSSHEPLLSSCHCGGGGAELVCGRAAKLPPLTPPPPLSSQFSERALVAAVRARPLLRTLDSRAVLTFHRLPLGSPCVPKKVEECGVWVRRGRDVGVTYCYVLRTVSSTLPLYSPDDRVKDAVLLVNWVPACAKGLRGSSTC